jgi:hypothetical protein
LAKTHRFKFSQIVGLKSVHTMLHYAVSASQSLGCKQRGRQCQSIAKTQRADLRSKIPRVGVGGGGGSQVGAAIVAVRVKAWGVQCVLLTAAWMPKVGVSFKII